MESCDIHFKNITFKDFTVEKWANNSNFWSYIWINDFVWDEIWNNSRIQTGSSYFKILDSKNIFQNIYAHSFLKYIGNPNKMAKKLENLIKFQIKNYWTIFFEFIILILWIPVCVLKLFQISSHAEPEIQKYGQKIRIIDHFSIVKSLKVIFLKWMSQLSIFILILTRTSNIV